MQTKKFLNRNKKYQFQKLHSKNERRFFFYLCSRQMKNLKKKNLTKKVKKENQIKTKGIEVGHIFYFGDKYSNH